MLGEVIVGLVIGYGIGALLSLILCGLAAPFTCFREPSLPEWKRGVEDELTRLLAKDMPLSEARTQARARCRRLR